MRPSVTGRSNTERTNSPGGVATRRHSTRGVATGASSSWYHRCPNVCHDASGLRSSGGVVTVRIRDTAKIPIACVRETVLTGSRRWPPCTCTPGPGGRLHLHRMGFRFALRPFAFALAARGVGARVTSALHLLAFWSLFLKLKFPRSHTCGRAHSALRCGPTSAQLTRELVHLHDPPMSATVTCTLHACAAVRRVRRDVRVCGCTRSPRAGSLRPKLLQDSNDIIPSLSRHGSARRQ